MLRGRDRSRGAARSRVSAARGFNAKSVANLSLWLRADQGVTGTTQVSQWNDLSGNANHATAAGAARPALNATGIGGLPAIDFDGVANVLTAGTNITTGAATYFVVAAQLTTSAAYRGLLSTQKHSLYARSAGSDIWEGYYNPDVSSTKQLTSTPAVLELCVRNFNDIDLSNNGAQVTSAAGTGYNANTATTVGQAGGSFFGNVRIAEILFYARVLTTAERSQVRKYLGARYGIPVT